MDEGKPSDHLRTLTDAHLSGSDVGGEVTPVIPKVPGFRVVEELAPGTGGMGRVFKAIETNLDRTVAIKTIRPHVYRRIGRKRFEIEAQAAAQLNHPHIVRIYSFNPSGELPYYVMEYVQGVPIDQYCEGLGFDRVVGLIAQVASALDYAHRLGLVHRDIKPANIIVDDEGRAHVTDFGLATRRESSTSEPQGEDALMGTPYFLAPETFAEPRRIGAGNDIYALGVTIYRLLTGRMPFRAESLDALREMVCRQDPPLPRTLRESIPEPLQRICLKAMDREPAARYQNMDQLANDLRQHQRNQDVAAIPSQYRREFELRAGKHIEEIENWEHDRLISRGAKEELLYPYRMLLEDETPWEVITRESPWEAILLRIGVWLLQIGTLCWPLLYWHKLEEIGRLLTVGLPILVSIGIARYFSKRGRLQEALIFHALGGLLIPVFLAVLLTMLNLFRFEQPLDHELLLSQPGVPNLMTELTNAQLLVIAVVFAAYAALLVRKTSSRLFDFWFGAGLYMVLTCVLLNCGLKDWFVMGRYAMIAAFYLAATVLSRAIGWFLDREGARRYANVFNYCFLVPFIMFSLVLSYSGAVEWLGASWLPSDPVVNVCLAANALFFFVLAYWCFVAKDYHVQVWHEALSWVGSVVILVSTHFLYGKGVALANLGSRPMVLGELWALGVVIVLSLIGAGMNYKPLVIPARIGFIAIVFRFGATHFLEYMSWPIAVAVAGGLAIGFGILLGRRRRRRQIATQPVPVEDARIGEA